MNLIETFEQIREAPEHIYELLRRHQVLHCHEYYYSERRRTYPHSASKRAAQFIYLNRTCWNGLYRVNLKGDFNVPRGTKTTVLLDTDNFLSIAEALRGAQLYAQDFSVTLQQAKAGDFVYVDPSYTVKHKYNGFTKYNERMFGWDDQLRLRREVICAIDRGALVAISNADHESLRDLYRDIGSLRTLSRKSVIAANSKHRGSIDELLVLSWIK